MKKLVPLMIIIMTILISFSIKAAHSDQIAQIRHQRIGELMQIAKEKGSVRVMLELVIPEYDELIQKCNMYETGIEDNYYRSCAEDADRRLAETIHQYTEILIQDLSGCEFTITHRFSLLPYVAMEISAEGLELLKTNPRTLRVMEDKFNPMPKLPNANTSSPQLSDSTDVIGAQTAWSYGFTGSGWYVAILDTGIRRSHEMFSGKTIVERCYSVLKDCPNGQSEMSGRGAAAHNPKAKLYSSAYDHGTHVAGIAAGNNRNNKFGVAKNANIIAIQVFSVDPSFGLGSYNADQIKALEYLYSVRSQYKIASANMSLGSEDEFSSDNACDNAWSQYSWGNPAFKTAVANLRKAGIATVIAAGNGYSCKGISSPGCISNAIGVGSTSKIDYESSFSNFYPNMVELFAPGEYISSARDASNTTYGNMSGTSMATPHVAGAWAILKHYKRSLSVAYLLDVLQDTGTELVSKCGSQYLTPRINIDKAIQKLEGVAPPANVAVDQVQTKTTLLIEYANKITWQANPINQNNPVASYKVYLYENGTHTALATVNNTTFEFYHRKVGKRVNKTYALSTTLENGTESLFTYYTTDFGTTQE
jgi:subtilisin family serine protease